MGVKATRQPLRTPAEEAETAEMESLAALAKALAHPARMKLVAALLRRRSCIGCDLVEEVGLAASTTSEHLRILKEAGLIVGEIAHPKVCYSLNPAAVRPLRAFLQLVEAAPPVALPATTLQASVLPE